MSTYIIRGYYTGEYTRAFYAVYNPKTDQRVSEYFGTADEAMTACDKENRLLEEAHNA